MQTFQHDLWGDVTDLLHAFVHAAGATCVGPNAGSHSSNGASANGADGTNIVEASMDQASCMNVLGAKNGPIQDVQHAIQASAGVCLHA